MRIFKTPSFGKWAAAEELGDEALCAAMRGSDGGHVRCPEYKAYTPDDIRQIRANAHVSQTVFAHCLNVGPTTVQKWEQGAKKPGGASLRLLQIVEAGASPR